VGQCLVSQSSQQVMFTTQYDMALAICSFFGGGSARLSDDIIQINPTDGKVVAFYDFGTLFPINQRVNTDQVLNGIAYDHDQKLSTSRGRIGPKCSRCLFASRIPPKTFVFIMSSSSSTSSSSGPSRSL